MAPSTSRISVFLTAAVLTLLFAITPIACWRPWPHLNPNSSGLLYDASKKFEGSSEFVHLRYHMGPVLTGNITVHTIWYGRWQKSQKKIIRGFINSISDVHARHPSVAGWWRTVQLYTDQTGANISHTVQLGQEKNDRFYSHGKSLTRLSIQSVIRSAVTARTKPLPINPRNGLYLLLTSDDVYVQDFCGQVCGFHYFTFPSIVGYTLPYAWVGNSAKQCPGVCAYPFAVPEFRPGWKFKLTNPSKEQREEIANLRDEELVKRLYQIQLEKKCLVILDDIWTIPTWNNLCPAFPYWKTAGSKILLTTRKMDVALHPDPTCFLHVPPQLNDDESWELFKKKACVDNNYPDVRTRAEIERLGREMVGRCTGLPLAIIVLGGLLATKKTIFEWDVVRQNIISHLRRGKGDEQLLGVTEVLALSYHELPYQLKPCFLHLAHFPEDCEIQTKKMIRMWVAEGFVSSVYNGVEEETMEDVAQRYLGELVERCMVQVVERGTTGRIRTCRMHDLMRDLCVSKAKQENFLEVFNQSLASDHSADSFPRSMVREARSIGRLRRLAVVLEGDLHKFIPSGYKRNSHLRSLLYFHEKACHAENWGSIKSVFKNFKLLRVLDLEGIQSHGGKLAKEIGNLIHLRFLSLRDTDIDELPSTIGNLRYLQTLDLLTWNSTVQIPNVVWRLNRLRHLYLPESCGEDSYKWQLANLVNLQTLVNFPAEKCEITDLVRLNHLKKLVIDDPKFGAIFRSPRVRFYRLQSLSFVSNEDSTVVQVIQGCPNLYKLHIEGQIEKLPECQQFSANLAKLNLLGSKLTEDPMPTLEKLPNLRILRLQMDSFLGNKMVCLDKGFPQLKSLFLYDLPNLEEWEVVEGAMANLFHLEISNCTSLKTVPEGLRFITSLREMEIRSMLKAFRTRLEHGGEDYYKVQHVPSIAFRYCDY